MSTGFDQLSQQYLTRNSQVTQFSLNPTGTQTQLSSVDPVTGDFVGLEWVLITPDSNSTISTLDADDFSHRFRGFRTEPEIIRVGPPYNPTSYTGNFEFQPLTHSIGGATGHNLTRAQELALRDFNAGWENLIPIGTMEIPYTSVILEYEDFEDDIIDGTVFMVFFHSHDTRITIDGTTNPSGSTSTSSVGLFRAINSRTSFPYRWVQNWKSKSGTTGTLYATCFGTA